MYAPLRWLAPELVGERHGGVITMEQTKPSNVWYVPDFSPALTLEGISKTDSHIQADLLSLEELTWICFLKSSLLKLPI